MALFGLLGAIGLIGKARKVLGGVKKAGRAFKSAVGIKSTAGLAGAGRAITRTMPGIGSVVAPVATGIAAVGAVKALRSAQDDGGTGKKYRRMQVTNMRALDRALRRVQGFEKRVRKVVSITRPRSQGGTTVRFKSKKRA